MGILGQQGTGRDLGRTKDDPDESAIALALSGGAELQWAVWPTNTDRNVTAWGHGMASQRWTHVAAVNDGRYTDLYIDGALMGRNPLSPAIGLGSTGKYWMLGATDYGNVVEQTFNGLIGDVRIVDRALPPTKFMNAARTPATNEATAAALSGRTVEVAVTGAASSRRTCRSSSRTRATASTSAPPPSATARPASRSATSSSRHSATARASRSRSTASPTPRCTCAPTARRRSRRCRTPGRRRPAAPCRPRCR